MKDGGTSPDVDAGNEPSHNSRRTARGSGPGGERVTVNLTEKAAQAMADVVELTADNKTDTINRALVIYAEIVRVTHGGGALYWREKEGADLERLRFL
jgi:hypothetical protein